MDNPQEGVQPEEVISESPLPEPTQEPKLMTFLEAMVEVVNNNAKVTQKGWGNKDHVLVQDGWLEIFKEDENKFHQWVIGDNNITANDWMIFE